MTRNWLAILYTSMREFILINIFFFALIFSVSKIYYNCHAKYTVNTLYTQCAHSNNAAKMTRDRKKKEQVEKTKGTRYPGARFEEERTSIMSLRIHSCQSSLEILLFSFHVLASVAAATGSFLMGAVIVSSEMELEAEEELPPRPDAPPDPPFLSSPSSGKNGSYHGDEEIDRGGLFYRGKNNDI